MHGWRAPPARAYKYELVLLARRRQPKTASFTESCDACVERVDDLDCLVEVVGLDEDRKLCDRQATHEVSNAALRLQEGDSSAASLDDLDHFSV